MKQRKNEKCYIAVLLAMVIAVTQCNIVVKAVEEDSGKLIQEESTVEIDENENLDNGTKKEDEDNSVSNNGQKSDVPIGDENIINDSGEDVEESSGGETDSMERSNNPWLPYDSVVYGKILSLGYTDSYLFNAPYKGQYVLDYSLLAPEGMKQIKIKIKNSEGKVIQDGFGDGLSGKLSIVLNPGEYQVSVVAQYSYAGQYGQEYQMKLTKSEQDQTADTLKEATANNSELTYDEYIKEKINYDGDYDYYKLTAPYKGQYVIDYNLLLPNDNKLVKLRLWDSTGKILIDGSGDGKNGQMSVALNPGDYYISVSAQYAAQYGQEYQLKLTKSDQDRTADTLEKAKEDNQELPFDEYVKEKINHNGDEDYYKLSAPYKGQYIIDYNLLLQNDNRQVKLRLWDSTGKILIDGSGDGKNGQMSVALNPGDYYISVSAQYAGNYGQEYRLKLTKSDQDRTADTLEKAKDDNQELPFDEYIKEKINHNGDEDYYKLSAPYKGQYIIDYNLLLQNDNRQIKLRLWDSTGKILIDGSGDGKNGQMSVALNPGDYYISVSTQYAGNYGQEYQIKLTKTDQDQTADTLEKAKEDNLELPYDKYIKEKINYNGDEDYYKLSAPYKGQYIIDYNLFNPDGYKQLKLRLWDSTGKVLVDGAGDGLTGQMSVTLNQGDYYISVSAQYAGNYGQDYQIKVKKSVKDIEADTADPFWAQSIQMNSGYTYGQINYNGDIDYFKLNVTKEDIINIDVLGISGSINATLYDANGRIINSTISIGLNGTMSQKLMPGIYYVKIQQRNQNEYGLVYGFLASDSNRKVEEGIVSNWGKIEMIFGVADQGWVGCTMKLYISEQNEKQEASTFKIWKKRTAIISWNSTNDMGGTLNIPTPDHWNLEHLYPNGQKYKRYNMQEKTDPSYLDGAYSSHIVLENSDIEVYNDKMLSKFGTMIFCDGSDDQYDMQIKLELK